MTIRLSLIIVLTCFCCSLHSQGLRVKNKTIIDAKGNEVILRGMGLGGWMLQEPYMLQLSGIASTQLQIKNRITELIGNKDTEFFYNAWLKSHCTKTDIDSMAAWGFNSVRLPMHFNLFTLPAEEEPVKGKNTWLKKGFALTDSLLKWCKANKMYLILDLHAAPGGQGNDIAIADRDTSKPSLWQGELNRQKTIALWEKLAARYVNEEWIGGYDLINEPNWGFENDTDKNGCEEKTNIPLRKLYVDITTVIRKIDKKHIIIIEGNCWGNNYSGMFPLWDDQLVLSFHKYWNYNNPASIQNALNTREQYNVPIWYGETGENSNAWFTDAIELFQKNNIGWAWWPLKKFGLNNPLQVKMNQGYKNIIDYWRGNAAKPSKEEAIKALMQLTEDIKATNNIYRKDVVDAMFRQVKHTGTIPYKQHTLRDTEIVFAVDYDMGRSSYAYHDKDSANYWVSGSKMTVWNTGRMYRNDGVDIEACTDSITNGYNVGWIEAGEWMQYTLNNISAGRFNIEVRYAAKDSTGELRILVNEVIASVAILPRTNDNQKWQSAVIKNTRLGKGTNRIRLLVSREGFNLNYVKFIRVL